MFCQSCRRSISFCRCIIDDQVELDFAAVATKLGAMKVNDDTASAGTLSSASDKLPFSGFHRQQEHSVHPLLPLDDYNNPYTIECHPLPPPPSPNIMEYNGRSPSPMATTPPPRTPSRSGKAMSPPWAPRKGAVESRKRKCEEASVLTMEFPLSARALHLPPSPLLPIVCEYCRVPITICRCVKRPKYF